MTTEEQVFLMQICEYMEHLNKGIHKNNIYLWISPDGCGSLQNGIEIDLVDWESLKEGARKAAEYCDWIDSGRDLDDYRDYQTFYAYTGKGIKEYDEYQQSREF